jgi:CheY-like chemotaxis protein
LIEAPLPPDLAIGGQDKPDFPPGGGETAKLVRKDDCMLLQGLRVFLVEDETMVAMLIEDMLDALGCEVVGVAVSVDQGLAGVETLAEVDVAVLDVNLGGQMVFPVAEALLARRVPFVFSTGYGTDGVADRYPFAQVLAKPYGVRALAAALADFGAHGRC